jgi:hypothetical protein
MKSIQHPLAYTFHACTRSQAQSWMNALQSVPASMQVHLTNPKPSRRTKNSYSEQQDQQ